MQNSNIVSLGGNSYIRILHASPDAPPVDIYVNNNMIASNLKYKDFTDYKPLQSGVYNIKVFAAGTQENPVINTDYFIPGNSIITVAATDKLENISLLPINDTQMPINPSKVYLRFGHLSPDAPSVDVRLPDGTNLFEDVEFKEVTDYIEVNPGTYTVEVFPTGTDTQVLYVPNIQLKPNRFYTVYAVGLVEDEPPLEVLIPLDGNSYIRA